MISTINNGQLAKKSFVIQSYKKSSSKILNVLWDEGYILGYKKSLKSVKIFLKYQNGLPAITLVKVVSKPSLRTYYSVQQLWKLNLSNSLLILSTNKGFLSDKECKKKNRRRTFYSSKMNFVSKRYIVKIPSEIVVIYSKSKNIILFKTKTRTKILHLNVKLLILKEKNIIVVTDQFSKKFINKKITKCAKTIQGITVSLIKQFFTDVQNLTYKKLKLVGVGYKVFEDKTGCVDANNVILQLKLGYSHSIFYKVPRDINVKTHQATKIFLSGSDLVKLSQSAALIRNCKTPEPYKGKGILYSNEIIKLKEGKKV